MAARPSGRMTRRISKREAIGLLQKWITPMANTRSKLASANGTLGGT
jgi:hypothetical protein